MTSEHVDILRSLSEAKYLRHRESPYAGYLQVLASFLLSSLVLGLILLYLYAFRNELYRRTEILVLFGILLIIPTLVASYLSGTADVSSLYVPVALSAMLVALLLDIELGITVAVMSAILCGVALNDLHATIVSSLCGMVGCYLGQTRKKSSALQLLYHLSHRFIRPGHSGYQRHLVLLLQFIRHFRSACP